MHINESQNQYVHLAFLLLLDVPPIYCLPPKTIELCIACQQRYVSQKVCMSCYFKCFQVLQLCNYSTHFYQSAILVYSYCKSGVLFLSSPFLSTISILRSRKQVCPDFRSLNTPVWTITVIPLLLLVSVIHELKYSMAQYRECSRYTEVASRYKTIMLKAKDIRKHKEH